MTEVFLDSAYAIALSAPNDQYHQKAVLLAEQLEATGARITTARAVVLEIGNALARFQHRKTAVTLLDSLEQDPNVEIIPLSEDIYRRALQMYRGRTD